MNLVIADEDSFGRQSMTGASEAEDDRGCAPAVEVEAVDVTVVFEAERHGVPIGSYLQSIVLLQRDRVYIDKVAGGRQATGERRLVVRCVSHAEMPAGTVVPQVHPTHVASGKAIRASLRPARPRIVMDDPAVSVGARRWSARRR